MKIWIYLNGTQQGPYTPEEITAMELPSSTPVWYEGLPQWLPASEAPLTAPLFAGHVAASCEKISGQEFAAAPSHAAADASQFREPQLPCPPTYLGWSIFVTICCCLPGGIIAIVFSSRTTSLYEAGRYEEAVKMSEKAQWAIILSIVLGLLSMPVAMLF